MKALTISAILAFIICSCNNNSSTTPAPTSSDTSNRKPYIKEEAITYNLADTVFNGYIAYDGNDTVTKKPAVLVVHEWWGVNDYVRSRAKQLASMGYVAMVVDMYGGGLTAPDPQQAQKLATPFYENPVLARQRLDAALMKLRTFNQVDSTRTAAIGYCFGGFVVLNAAKLGSDLDAVVSFHGGLGGAPAKKDLLKAKILICHGAADNFVPQQEIDLFRKQMDSAGASYVFRVYPDATHAFTNPDATATGERFKLPIQYNAAADSASWEDMKLFLKNL
jgi:dienelactone hydrolase